MIIIATALILQVFAAVPTTQTPVRGQGNQNPAEVERVLTIILEKTFETHWEVDPETMPDYLRPHFTVDSDSFVEFFKTNGISTNRGQIQSILKHRLHEADETGAFCAKSERCLGAPVANRLQIFQDPDFLEDGFSWVWVSLDWGLDRYMGRDSDRFNFDKGTRTNYSWRLRKDGSSLQMTYLGVIE